MSTTLKLRAMYGLLDGPPETSATRDQAISRAAAALDAALRPGHLALITGPSGAGKSTLARALLERLDSHTPAPPAPPDPDATPAEVLRGPLSRRLRTLADVGLADAHVFTRSIALLSAGERARLDIARAIDRLHRHAPGPHTSSPTAIPTLILDEFASTLDRPGACRLARLLRRWLARHPGARIVCITAHEDLAPHLAPDLLLRITRQEGSPPRISTTRRPDAAASAPDPAPPAPHHPILIQHGTRADYHALARFHYRAGAPAVIAGPGAILRAVDPSTGALAGVLIIAMPTLNARWRDIIWPGRYRTGNKRADAARLHADLRCIARVIVHPDYRALGVGVALVRHYLAHPLTPATEALAAMRAATPLFARAGMHAYTLPPTPRDARLRDALAFLGLTPHALLAAHHTPVAQHELIQRELVERELIQRELCQWAAASRATRALLPDPPAIARRAAAALLAPPIVYAHVSPGSLPSSRNPESAHAPPARSRRAA